MKKSVKSKQRKWNEMLMNIEWQEQERGVNECDCSSFNPPRLRRCRNMIIFIHCVPWCSYRSLTTILVAWSAKNQVGNTNITKQLSKRERERESDRMKKWMNNARTEVVVDLVRILPRAQRISMNLELWLLRVARTFSHLSVVNAVLDHLSSSCRAAPM